MRAGAWLPRSLPCVCGPASKQPVGLRMEPRASCNHGALGQRGTRSKTTSSQGTPTYP